MTNFENTPELAVFDVLNVPLYHGWLLDPQDTEIVKAVNGLSFNQLVEKIITGKESSDEKFKAEGKKILANFFSNLIHNLFFLSFSFVFLCLQLPSPNNFMKIPVVN